MLATAIRPPSESPDQPITHAVAAARHSRLAITARTARMGFVTVSYRCSERPPHEEKKARRNDPPGLVGRLRLPNYSPYQNDRVLVTSQVRGSGILAEATVPSGSALIGISVEL